MESNLEQSEKLTKESEEGGKNDDTDKNKSMHVVETESGRCKNVGNVTDDQEQRKSTDEELITIPKTAVQGENEQNQSAGTVQKEKVKKKHAPEIGNEDNSCTNGKTGDVVRPRKSSKHEHPARKSSLNITHVEGEVTDFESQTCESSHVDSDLQKLLALHQAALEDTEESDDETEPNVEDISNITFDDIKEVVKNRTLPWQYTFKETKDVTCLVDQHEQALLAVIYKNKQFVETALKLTEGWTDDGQNVKPWEVIMMLVLLRSQMRYLISQYGVFLLEERRTSIPPANPGHGLHHWVRGTDEERMQEVLDWISAVTGDAKIKDQPFKEVLKNGVVICELINKISPGSVKRIQRKGTKFTFMENIEAYQKASAAYGVPEEDRFMPTDLVESRNLKAVIKGLYALGRTAKNKGYDGPTLGPKMAEAHQPS